MRLTNRYCIFNADDFNRTKRVSQGILKAMTKGPVTSTTVMVNLPLSGYEKEVRALEHVSIGLHVNMTYGKALSPRKKAATLTRSDGTFFTYHELMSRQVDRSDIARELVTQIEKFHSIFRRVPSHLDSHHHIHARDAMYTVFADAARRLGIPLRKRYLNEEGKPHNESVMSTDYAYARFDGKKPWSFPSLRTCIRSLRPGVSEIIVHPGYADAALRKASRFAEGREQELEALLDPRIQKTLRDNSICVINFKDLLYVRQ